MAEENMTELGITTQGAVAEVLRLAGVLDRYVGSLDKVASATVSFNAKGKASAVAIRELDENLNSLTTRLKATKTGWKTVSEGASDAVVKYKEMMAAMREALVTQAQRDRETQAGVAGKALRDETLGPNAASASSGEMRRYEAAIRSVTNEIARGKMSLQEMDALWRKAASGSQDFTYAEQAVVNKFQAIQAAANEFGTAAVNASNRAARAAQVHLAEQQKVLDALHMQAAANRLDQERAAAVRGAQGQLSQAFGTKLASATPAQVIAYNATISQAIGLLQRGKVSGDQFSESLARVAAGKPASGLTGDLARLESSLMRARNSFETIGKTGDGAGKRILMSWQNVVKMFEGQFLFHIFSQLQQGFQQGIAQAQEFSKKVALIQTISQDSGVSYGQWARGIREVSDAMGTPLVETASAGYDLLTNQVTRGAETMGVLRQAMEFGRTTNASTEDSVNLLSSAINAFQMGPAVPSVPPACSSRRSTWAASPRPTWPTASAGRASWPRRSECGSRS
jgi:hypothetical protein